MGKGLPKFFARSNKNWFEEFPKVKIKLKIRKSLNLGSKARHLNSIFARSAFTGLLFSFTKNKNKIPKNAGISEKRNIFLKSS